MRAPNRRRRTRRPAALLLLVRLVLLSYTAGIRVLHGLRHVAFGREDYTPVERGGCLSQASVRQRWPRSRATQQLAGSQLQQSARRGATPLLRMRQPSTARRKHGRAANYGRNAYYSVQHEDTKGGTRSMVRSEL